MLFSPFDINLGGMLQVVLAVQTLKKAGGHIVPKVLKTWLNGWVTSHRMQEDPILPCLLGCLDQKDTLKHYIMCPHMYAFQRFPLAEVSSDPLVRFGFKDPSLQSMRISSCLFSAYHAVKAKVRSGIIDVHEDTMTSPTIRVSWTFLLKLLLPKQGDCVLPHVHSRSASVF